MEKEAVDRFFARNVLRQLTPGIRQNATTRSRFDFHNVALPDVEKRHLPKSSSSKVARCFCQTTLTFNAPAQCKFTQLYVGPELGNLCKKPDLGS